MISQRVALGAAGLAALVVVALWSAGALDRDDAASAAGLAPRVIVPELSAKAQEGRALFAETCAACHGANGGGTNAGPPLIHRIYEPSHHGDGAFHLAVMQGVRAHHWQFGDMPPMPGVSRAQAARIVTFVREVQRANGID